MSERLELQAEMLSPKLSPPSALVRKRTLHVRPAGVVLDKEFLDAFSSSPLQFPCPKAKRICLLTCKSLAWRRAQCAGGAQLPGVGAQLPNCLFCSTGELNHH